MLVFSMSSLNANDLHRIFTKLDKNGDGLISIEELKWLLEKIGFNTTLDELQPLVGRSTSLDSIDFYFFYDIIVKKNDSISRSKENEISNPDGELAEAFKVFDLNGDGFISSEELQSALLRLGLWDEQYGRDCKSMIDVYDVNSDGKLDFEEFKNMMLFSPN